MDQFTTTYVAMDTHKNTISVAIAESVAPPEPDTSTLFAAYRVKTDFVGG